MADSDNGNGIGVWCRSTDTSNAILIGADNGTNGLKNLSLVVAGVYAVLSAATLTLAPSTIYDWVVTLSEIQSISTTLNGVTVTATEATYSTNTKHGLRSGHALSMSTAQLFYDFACSP